jgi:hypothetical protein
MMMMVMITTIIKTWTKRLVLYINLKYKIATPTKLNVYISFITEQQQQKIHQIKFAAVNVLDISRNALEFWPT